MMAKGYRLCCLIFELNMLLMYLTLCKDFIIQDSMMYLKFRLALSHWFEIWQVMLLFLSKACEIAFSLYQE